MAPMIAASDANSLRIEEDIEGMYGSEPGRVADRRCIQKLGHDGLKPRSIWGCLAGVDVGVERERPLA